MILLDSSYTNSENCLFVFFVLICLLVYLPLVHKINDKKQEF
jgi:hypothetical protein